MYTDKRLTKAYINAKLKYYDKNSKYIFFSDLHRGDDSVSDEFTRNQTVMVHALDYYFNRGYTYVEVGDGDELWEYPNFKHIRLAHGDVFTVMKKFYDQKRMILLYGNHNIRLKNKGYVKNNYYRYYDEYQQSYYKLFPGIVPQEALILKNRNSGQEIFVVHGHQGDLLNDQLWIISMIMLRFFWKYLHVVGFRNPASPARNLYKRHKIERTFTRWIRRHKKMLICGHTHRPRFPKKDNIPYFNTGCGVHTKGVTGIEIVDGKIMMIDWRMKPNEEGIVRITRTIVRGPKPINQFLKVFSKKTTN